MTQKIKVILVQETESDYSYFESYFQENGFSPQISVASSAEQFCRLLERNTWDLVTANQGVNFSPEKVKLFLAEKKSTFLFFILIKKMRKSNLLDYLPSLMAFLVLHPNQNS